MVARKNNNDHFPVVQKLSPAEWKRFITACKAPQKASARLKDIVAEVRRHSV